MKVKILRDFRYKGDVPQYKKGSVCDIVESDFAILALQGLVAELEVPKETMINDPVTPTIPISGEPESKLEPEPEPEPESESEQKQESKMQFKKHRRK